jgi:hypothetical protein
MIVMMIYFDFFISSSAPPSLGLPIRLSIFLFYRPPCKYFTIFSLRINISSTLIYLSISISDRIAPGGLNFKKKKKEKKCALQFARALSVAHKYTCPHPVSPNDQNCACCANKDKDGKLAIILPGQRPKSTGRFIIFLPTVALSVGCFFVRFKVFGCLRARTENKTEKRRNRRGALRMIDEDSFSVEKWKMLVLRIYAEREENSIKGKIKLSREGKLVCTVRLPFGIQAQRMPEILCNCSSLR